MNQRAPAPATRASGPLAPYLSLRAQLAAQRVGDGGPDVCAALTSCLDGCLASLAEPLLGERFALVAVGGYGRGELCLYSDVDLMLLHAGSLPRRAIETILYPLWDAGLKVGHAVRSLREALTAASTTLATLTALLDARTVAGDPLLVAELLNGLGSRLRRGRIAFQQPLSAAEHARRAREPFQLLEADLKEGRGGLRSLQSIHWERRRRELTEGDSVPPERSEVEARATLLATRNALHSAAARPFERYVFELRAPAAAWLGLDAMAAGRRLYGAMRVVDALAARCWGLPIDPLVAPRRRSGPVARILPPRLGRARRSLDPPGMPAAPSPLAVASRALDRSPGEPLLTSEEERLIHASIASDPGADRAALVHLLAAGHPGWTLFQALESLGWIARALPEWRHVVAAPQEAPFHLHPVDVHLWRTVIELRTITGPQSDEAWCREVAAELGSLDETLLAAIFHDLGKGWPGDHSAVGARAATALLRRFGFGPAIVARVSNAIRYHLLLPDTAMRRDTDDPAVVGLVAGCAGDLRTLRMLYLVSIADARATGPSVWNPWKASLLRSLFANTARELERRAGGGEGSPSYTQILDALESVALGRFDRRTLTEHLEAMPDGYAEAFEPADLLRHLEAMTPPPRGSEAIIATKPEELAASVIVAAEDRPGLLATISGVFALNNVSILDGRFYTRADGVALDLFHVQDALGHALDDRRWQRVREQMPSAMRGDLDMQSLLREKARAYRRAAAPGRAVVHADAGPAGASGIVEVHCTDRIGLLYQIAHGLYELGLDIRLAKVDTRGPQVIDSFYVRDAVTGLVPPLFQLREHARALETMLNGWS